MVVIPTYSRIDITDQGVDLAMLPIAINITALDDAVSLVHIPISTAGESDTHSTRIYWTVERACEESQEFFNVTSNRVEVAIFASKELVESEWGQVTESDTGVRLSEGWRVFEINSGDAEEDSSENYDSPHLRYVSAPLAKAGITILYQSSYHADFLLVKEADFERASGIFAGHGWTINPTSNPSPRLFISPASSGPGTPSTPRARSSFGGIPSYPASISTTPIPSPPPSRPPVDISPPLTAIPSGHDITSLPSSLAFVGFHHSSPNFQLHTGLVQKYLTWPGRCRTQFACPPFQRSDEGSESDRPFISYTRTQDGASLVTEVKIIRGMFKGLEEGMMCGDEMGEGWETQGESDLERVGQSESESDEESGTSQTSGVSDSRSGSETETETDRCSDTEVDDDEEEDGETRTPRPPNTPNPADIATAPRPGLTATPTSSGEYFTFPARPRPGALPLPLQPPRRSGSSQRRNRVRHRKTQSVPTTPGPLGLQPGFDLDDDSPIRDKSKMHKRRSTVGRGLSGSRSRERSNAGQGSNSSSKGRGIEGEGEKRKKKGRKICIQLDMTGVGSGGDESGVYHLDKSGLVTRFSTLLSQANIRMLYSSTFHTANILVEAKDVRSARKLLAAAK